MPEVKCTTCGKIVNHPLSQIKKSKSGKQFCSRHCSAIYTNTAYKSGKNNPNFISGIGTYRNRALKEYGQKCALCGYNKYVDVLEVHHVDGNRKNNSIENLMVLCPTCHKEVKFRNVG